MCSEKDILARLQRGEKPEDIAKEMTAKLNAAIDQKNKEDAAKAEAEAKKKASVKHLETAAAEINAYMKEWFPDAVKRGVSITPSDVREVIKTVVETDTAIGYVTCLMGDIFKKADQHATTDPIEKFLKDHKL